MLQALTEKLRVIVHRGMQETGSEGPVLKRVREVANTVNDLLGKPIHGAEGGTDTVVAAAALKNILFKVNALDPTIYLVVSGLLTLVAAASCFVPARRATRVNPMVALRTE